MYYVCLSCLSLFGAHTPYGRLRLARFIREDYAYGARKGYLFQAGFGYIKG